ncbi:MAG: hypothetical protein ABR599_06955 [Gemmatimonadota bacterium]
MYDRIGYSVACMALAAALGLGCQQRQDVDDDAEPDTLAITDTEMEPATDVDLTRDTALGADTGAMAGMGGSAGLSVTNTMPHEMIVVARWGTPQVERVLGPVAANETKSFDLAAPAGERVGLTATDSGNTHSVEGTVSADASSPATWTIQ